MQHKAIRIVGNATAATAIAGALSVSVWKILMAGLQPNQQVVFIVLLILAALGVLVLVVRHLRQAGLRSIVFKDLRIELEPPPSAPPKELSEDEMYARKKFVEARVDDLPGRDAEEFSLLKEKLVLTVTPSGDPLTPMYTLDENFRILEWNESFSLCFDRTMEGLKGSSVLEWTYFLDNYDAVIDHGIEAFNNRDPKPHYDCEVLGYTSKSYGKLQATKRAYHIPGESDTYLGWVVTVEPQFDEPNSYERFAADVFASLHLSLVWSEYALSYDAVLTRTKVYQELVDTIIGKTATGPSPIRNDATILDLGAGTGNVTKRLVMDSASRRVLALDKNKDMLNILRQKCVSWLRDDFERPGVMAIRQDMTSLKGLDEDFFDYVIANNVLYSIDTPAAVECLEGARRLLKKGGEIRVSGPRKDTDLDRLFRCIENDLKANGQWKSLEKHYQKVVAINYKYLAPMLKRWSVEDLKEMLLKAGFTKISHVTQEIYAGQSMLVCAIK